MRAFWLAVVTALAAFASFAASASAQSPQVMGLKVVSEADLAPQGHYRFIVHSEKIDRDFAVTVTMPVAYAKFGPPATKVAAIYALDNGYDIAGPLAQMLSRSGAMSPAYVVSIGYVEGQPNMRQTDYTYQGPGAEAFRQFLTSELRPFIEARYPLDPVTGLPVTDVRGRAVPREVHEGQPNRMQGAAVHGSTWFLTASAGEDVPGDLYVGAPGAWVHSRGVLPPGPEDLAWARPGEELWCVSEWPGRRWVFPIAADRWTPPR